MNNLSGFSESWALYSALPVRPNTKKRLDILRLVVFFMFVLIVAFSAQTVHADGETPPSPEETDEVIVVPSGDTTDIPVADSETDPSTEGEADPVVTDPAVGGEIDPDSTDPVTEPTEGLLLQDESTIDETPIEEAVADPIPLPDPQFCSSGDPTGDACSESRTRIVTEGETPGALDDVNESGVIYLQKGVTFDEDINILEMEYDLTFSGGWDFVSNTFTLGDTSTLSGLISITNSSGRIKFVNIIFGPEPIVVTNSDVEIIGTGGNDALQLEVADSTVKLDGKAGSDTYTVDPSGSNTIDVNDSGGSEDSDTLVVNGLDTDVVWHITDNNKGNVEGIHFSSVENLTGGGANDTFQFADGKGVSGTIDGGGGENTLDYSAYTSPVVVNLNSEKVKVDGTVWDPHSATGVGEGIVNILNVTGGTGNDILIGTGYGGTLEGSASDTVISSGPQLIIGPLKAFLQEFQQSLFSDVFANAIPLIGGVLGRECDEDTDVCPGAFINEYILAALETGFDNALVVDAASFLANFNAALGILVLSSSIGPSNSSFTVDLGKYDELFEVPFGTGLDGLPLAIGVPGETPPDVIGLDLDWDFNLTFGMDGVLGFYVDPSDTTLTVDIDASFLDQDPHLGTVGLFQAKIIDGVGDDLSQFKGTYTVTLSSAEDTHGPNLFDLPIEGSLTSEISQIYLTIDLAAFVLGDDLGLPEDVPNLFNMALRADVTILWDFVDADTNVAHGEFGNEPSVHFGNIYLDPGPFFNDFLRPYLEGIQKITKPLQPIIDILLAPIPLLSEFDLLPGTVLELLGANESIIVAIALINKINQINLESGECDPSVGDCTLWIPIGDGFDVTDPRDMEARIPIPEPLLGGWQPTWEMSSEKYGFASMGGDLFGDNSLFEFPILEDPNEVYGMLLGINARFITLNLPEMNLTYELPDDLKVCLYLTLCIKFYGEIGLTAGPMEFGYDTKGIADFVKGGSQSYGLLADGFYIADLCEVDGTTETCNFPYADGLEVERVPLVELHFDIGVSVSIGADLYIFAVEAGVAGGVEGSIRFNLHDGMIGLPNDINIDGRIRGSEIGYNASLGWTCIFDIEGEIEAYLKVYVEVSSDFGLFSITWYENSWDLARFTLVEFCQSCEGTPPALAHLEGNKLVLHTGDEAGTLALLSAYTENEYFTVTHVGGISGAETVTVSAYGFEQQFEGVSSIWADAGEGNDKLTINSGVLSDATLIGGNGDDTLVYKGSGTAWLYGEAGNDSLTGGAGENHLYGGKLHNNNEAEDGAPNVPGRIWVEPDPEKKIGIYDEVNDVWLGYFQRQFNDQLFGGSGINWLYAGNGDDKLFGGTGANHMYGEVGDDVLSSGEGTNYMNGGVGDDSFIWISGGGITTIFGGEGDKNTLFLNLKANTSQVTVGANGNIGQVRVNAELDARVSFQDIHELTINPKVGTQITINDVFATTLKKIYVNANIGSQLDTVTIYGRSLNDNILVDTQLLNGAEESQLAHVGFCADAQEFCPAGTEYLLELFVAVTPGKKEDLLIVNGGDGNDVFRVDQSVCELINLELQGGASFDTVLGPNTPNTWTMTGTNSGNLNNEFSFSEMEKLIGGTAFDVLVGPNFASTFRMINDFDGVLNNDLYYFSMEKLVGGSNNDTLSGSDTYNFWSLLSTNSGELYRFAGINGLMALLDELKVAGLFSNNGIYKSLQNRLELAQKALAMGHLERAAAEMWMFVWKLDDAAERGQLTLPGGSTVTACGLSNACRVGGTLVYDSFENLTGGNGNDLFVFEDGMGVSGRIDGADGTDWLDYSKYSTTVHINVKQGYATGTGGILNIERVFGRAPARDILGHNQTVTQLASTELLVASIDTGNASTSTTETAVKGQKPKK
jgi:Ca2+-binding RTX toxin-like protein